MCAVVRGSEPARTRAHAGSGGSSRGSSRHASPLLSGSNRRAGGGAAAGSEPATEDQAMKASGNKAGRRLISSPLRCTASGTSFLAARAEPLLELLGGHPAGRAQHQHVAVGGGAVRPVRELPQAVALAGD